LTKLIPTLYRQFGFPLSPVLAFLLTKIYKYLRRDPWTALSVLSKPSGPPVTDFIWQNKAAMYRSPLDAVSSRVLASHRPLVYQSALHLISGLSSIHSHNMIFGYLDLAHCWLSSDSHLSLSVVGLLNSGFQHSNTERWYDGDCTYAEKFDPYEHRSRSTTQSNIFLYGWRENELMRGF
jgi:hypothetical protein